MTLRGAFRASALVMLAGIAAMLLWSMPMMDAGGLALLDTRTGGYSFDAATAYLAALSPESRAAYLGPQRLTDTVFPLGLLGVLAFGIVLAFRRWSLPAGLILALVALAYFSFDMLENEAVAALLRAGAGSISPQMVAWASFCTIWKFRLVAAALAIFALGWGARGLAGFAGRVSKR